MDDPWLLQVQLRSPYGCPVIIRKVWSYIILGSVFLEFHASCTIKIYLSDRGYANCTCNNHGSSISNISKYEMPGGIGELYMK
jgi:hypothetical protein